MSIHKRSVLLLSNKFKVDRDEALLRLWYHQDNINERGVRFGYIKNVNSVVRKKDMDLAKHLLSLKKNGAVKQTHGRETIQTKTLPEYNFSFMGRIIDKISYLKKDDIIAIHQELINDFRLSPDPIFPPGVKDEDLLESALFHAQTSFAGKLKYPTVESSAAALFYAISNNHSFNNGNKRTAIVSMLVFLEKHNISLQCSEDELFKLSLSTVDHLAKNDEFSCPDKEVHEISQWIMGHSRIITRGERVITFKRLKQLLRIHGCQIEHNGHITRKLKRNFLGIKVTDKVLHSTIQIPNKPDGAEVDKGMIKIIRENLELDSSHGCNIDDFYAGIEFVANEFIVKYQNLLRRLAKF